MKTCNKCNTTKELDQYHKCSRSVGGYVQVCKKCRNTQIRAYEIKNADKIRVKKQKHYQKVKDERKACHEKNKARILERQYKLEKKRYHLDPNYRLLKLLRSGQYKVLNGTSKSASTIGLLGCTSEQAQFHIESQFTEGMTWNNIHIDHIQPCASFNLKDESEQAYNEHRRLQHQQNS